MTAWSPAKRVVGLGGEDGKGVGRGCRVKVEPLMAASDGLSSETVTPPTNSRVVAAAGAAVPPMVEP